MALFTVIYHGAMYSCRLFVCGNSCSLYVFALKTIFNSQGPRSSCTAVLFEGCYRSFLTASPSRKGPLFASQASSCAFTTFLSATASFPCTARTISRQFAPDASSFTSTPMLTRWAAAEPLGGLVAPVRKVPAHVTWRGFALSRPVVGPRLRPPSTRARTSDTTNASMTPAGRGNTATCSRAGSSVVGSLSVAAGASACHRAMKSAADKPTGSMNLVATIGRRRG
mmetsp:Transcript_15512/g.28626  ORF Transcript_15512/g.28626 Transcript_15512/m.28626 type:complete len:225 (-) Transcript_15512:2723-3397(-)